MLITYLMCSPPFSSLLVVRWDRVYLIPVNGLGGEGILSLLGWGDKMPASGFASPFPWHRDLGVSSSPILPKLECTYGSPGCLVKRQILTRVRGGAWDSSFLTKHPRRSVAPIYRPHLKQQDPTRNAFEVIEPLPAMAPEWLCGVEPSTGHVVWVWMSVNGG